MRQGALGLLYPRWAQRHLRFCSRLTRCVMGRTLAELLKASTVSDLSACCRLCRVKPRAKARKNDLIQDVLDGCQDPQKHRAVCNLLLLHMTVHELRQWLTAFRMLGFILPTCAAMGHRKTDMVEAIIQMDHPSTPAVAHAFQGNCKGQGVHPDLAEPGGNGGDVYNPPEPTVLVAFDSTAGPLHVRRKMCRKWSKLCRRAIRKGVSRRVAPALEA